MLRPQPFAETPPSTRFERLKTALALLLVALVVLLVFLLVRHLSAGSPQEGDRFLAA